MARPRTELSEILNALPGIEKVYFQAPTTLEYPCIIYELDDEFVAHADNIRYWFKKRYTITVIDRDPDSLIPDMVGDLKYSKLDRRYVVQGLHHTVYNLFF